MLRDTTSRGLCVRVWPFFAWPPYWTFFFYWTKIDKLKAHIRDTDDSEIGHPPESGSRAQTACSGPSRRGAPGPQWRASGRSRAQSQGALLQIPPAVSISCPANSLWINPSFATFRSPTRRPRRPLLSWCRRLGRFRQTVSSRRLRACGLSAPQEMRTCPSGEIVRCNRMSFTLSGGPPAARPLGPP